MSAAPVSAHPDERLARWPLIALGGLVALQVALILTHDPWRDELQALMLVRHSASLGELFANLHYEGHPSLWYLLLRAVAPLGSGAAALTVVQLAVALTTIAIVWLRAPFSPWTRLVILASYLIIFEWGTIARNYGLGVTLYFAFLALDRRPLAAYLLLGLVANVSAHFLLLAGVSAALLFVLDRDRRIAGPAIFAALALAAIVTAWPASDAQTGLTLAPTLFRRLADAFGSTAGALVPLNPGAFPPRWENMPPPASLLVTALIPVLGVFAVARRSVWAAALFMVLVAATFAFSFLVYLAHPRHTGVIFLFLVGIEWMLCERGRGPISLISRAWIAILVAFGLWMGAWALALPFSAMREVARFIDTRGLSEAQWAAYPSFTGVELSGRLGRPYYDVQRQCLAWFQRWDTASTIELSPEEIDARLVEAAERSGGRILLLTSLDFDPARAPRLDHMADFAAGLVSEPMHIYAVAPPASAPSASELAPCDLTGFSKRRR